MIIGDIVTTKSLGLPAIGEIVAIYSGEAYAELRREKVRKSLKFLVRESIETYYTVKFDPPIKSLSIEEIMDQYRWKRLEAEEYHKSLPTYKYLDYPESDLEIF